jgi:hypothetical protein
MSIKLINFNFQDNRPVAQLAEHVTLNHGVEGSIPSGPTLTLFNERYISGD